MEALDLHALCGASMDMTAERETFAALIERLYREQHTGPVTIHFAQGQPNIVDFPRDPERFVLDKGKKQRADLTR